ncbi:hypothetical protein JCM6882_000134 [Rhodosporidiobolus microsporus]
MYNTLTNQTLASEEFSIAILGPSVMGWAGQIALWGMVVAWAGDYFRSELFKRDPPRRKAILIFAVTLCTLQTGCNFYLLFKWSTHQERDAYVILEPSRVNALQPLSAGLLGATVQSFLASRAIGLLTKRWSKRLATAFFTVSIFLELFFSLFNVVLNQLFHDGMLSDTLIKLVTYSAISGIWLWFAAITDVGVTVVLCVVLRKRIAGFNESTDNKLRTLCWLAVQSASYTAVFALAGAISAYATPFNLLYSSIPFAFWYLLPSCYVLALITALCSRLILGAPTILGGVNAGGPITSHAPGLTSMGGVAFGGTDGRRSPFRRTASPNRQQLREKERFPGLGSGVHVAEEVSIHVSDADEDEFAPTRRARLVPPSPSVRRPAEQEEKVPEAAVLMEESSVPSDRKSSYGSFLTGGPS